MIVAHRLGLAALLALSACAVEGATDPELEDAEAIGYNAIGYNALVMNGLSANQAAHGTMIDVPLATASYNGAVPELADQLHDAMTREFMSYLVSCALRLDQVVTYTDRFDGKIYRWKGSLGLCPSWQSGPASTDCQEVVSACLLARNNAFGRRVQISMRGFDESGDALALAGNESFDFPWREGAFFGNLFADLVPEVDIYVDGKGDVQGRHNATVSGSIYPQMWACWSDIWTSPAAYAQYRVCAGGNVNCAATAVGACRGSRVGGVVNRCAIDDSLPVGDQDYQQCEGAGAGIWNNAVTVFLRGTCDLVPTKCDHF
jgi:hypothetical protein